MKTLVKRLQKPTLVPKLLNYPRGVNPNSKMFRPIFNLKASLNNSIWSQCRALQRLSLFICRLKFCGVQYILILVQFSCRLLYCVPAPAPTCVKYQNNFQSHNQYGHGTALDLLDRGDNKEGSCRN